MVFLGDRNTDFETYIHMVNQSIYDANPEKLPKLINAGMTCRLIFEDDEFKDLVLDMNPTHAVLAFGAEIAGSIGDKAQYRIPKDEYSGYIKRHLREIEKASENEALYINKSLDYLSILGLSSEAKEKLSMVKPQTLGQASRVSGVSPADVSVLMLYLNKP